VLVHCSRGKERSGVCGAVFRIEFDGWTNEQALAEMYGLGFKRGTLPALERFVASYQPQWRGGGTAVAAGTTGSSGLHDGQAHGIAGVSP
jgi:hypothetical protein